VAKYLKKGFGGLVGFGIKGGKDAGKTFIELREAALARGQHRRRQELVIHPASTTHQQLTAEEQASTGVTDDYIRLSIGLEDHVEDIDRSGAFRPNQFANAQNPLIHYLTTGPEIWEDSGGKVEVFVAGMGTGGTISGVARCLKEKNPQVTIVGADPEGSILSGDSPKSYKVEGIGEDFIPKTFNRQVVDDMVRVSDQESFDTARRLAREEGLMVGGSGGTAVAAALRYAQRLKQPRYIVVLLPDTGRNYLTGYFSDDWMRRNGFRVEAPPRPRTVADILRGKTGRGGLLSVGPLDPLSKAIATMQSRNISQLPVLEDGRLVGSLSESGVMKLLHDGADADRKVATVMARPLPTLEDKVDIAEAYRLLVAGAPAIVAVRDGQAVGIVTRADLISEWARQPVNREPAP
jgi:cystathionine beta-synthase